jgi:hypothetical protein
VSYQARGPFRDPGLADGVPSLSSVTLWTNGSRLVVQVSSGRAADMRLYQALEPGGDMAVDTRGLSYVRRITSKREWTDGEGRLVASRQRATRQRIYIELSNGQRCGALVSCPTRDEQLQEAAWLCLARHSVQAVASSNHDPGLMSYQASSMQSRAKALEHIAGLRGRCTAALDLLERSECPEKLSATRKVVLEVLGPAKSAWDIAWPLWHSALGQPAEVPVDYQSLTDDVKRSIEKGGVPALEWWRADDAITAAQEKLGLFIDLL